MISHLPHGTADSDWILFVKRQREEVVGRKDDDGDIDETEADDFSKPVNLIE